MIYPEEIEGLRMARRLVRGHIARDVDEINAAFDRQEDPMVYRFAATALMATMTDGAAALALVVIDRQLSEWVDAVEAQR